jgi:hypothetical protein
MSEEEGVLYATIDLKAMKSPVIPFSAQHACSGMPLVL